MRMSYPEYLAAEAGSEVRHEYLDGEVRPLARGAPEDAVGSTPEHSALAAAITVALGTLLRGKPCRVYSSDLRVRIEDTGLSTYPDVTVVCGQLATSPEDPDAVTNPVVLVEVLSPTTEAYDRGAKAAHYRQIPSLREYVLVSPDEPRIEVFRRVPDGWELREARAGGAVEIPSLGVRLDVSAVYRDPLSA